MSEQITAQEEAELVRLVQKIDAVDADQSLSPQERADKRAEIEQQIAAVKKGRKRHIGGSFGKQV